jgi:putative hemolysin
MTVLVILGVVTVLVAINAFYVAAEFATVAARRSRLRQLAAEGNGPARRLLPTLEDSRKLDDYIAACQLGITASSLVLGAYGQGQVAVALAPYLAALGNLAQPAAQSIAATGVLLTLTTLQVVFGELFPKSVAIQFREQVALAVVVPMQWSVALFRPFIWLFNGSANLLLRLFGFQTAGGHTHVHSPEEIELLAEESQRGGLVEPEERRLLHNAFRFQDLAVRQVMQPRTRMPAAPADSSTASLIERALAAGADRIALYRGTVDNIVGFVHLKDLFRLRLERVEQVREIIRGVTYVPESLPIPALWREFSNRRVHLAIVLDEYGGTAGMVTLEDLVDEVFGEVPDEFDAGIAMVRAGRDGGLRLRGDVLVADVNEFFDLRLPEGEADTLGGLIMAALGRIPAAGDEVVVGEPPATLRVEAMQGLAVAEVCLNPPGSPAAPDPEAASA